MLAVGSPLWLNPMENNSAHMPFLLFREVIYFTIFSTQIHWAIVGLPCMATKANTGYLPSCDIIQLFTQKSLSAAQLEVALATCQKHKYGRSGKV